ncbi:putative MFS family arabinose efflux permease [Actinoalloteichus hoggarensis]|uniref:Purine ribonucleoside efflux pump NepI n=1 Tax=Actinoalloteichus hoggarensis TaxID=1470176 RepID=A0A221VYS3_9PSEU|nr:MFS transporter [Actinoalloteichus hoggarensis]ASO18683.1 Purine ribonucleoside efflux pump NepI [Actinoalloteichus hoggarensis]MBB5919915.1 putative MFS family arabinose efflux permease [Actinoalloteichus hoggarensis]
MVSSTSVDAAEVPSTRTTVGQWAAVAVLSLSTFIVVTSEMLPVGVLTPMAEGLRISPGTTGFSLTITGLVTAVTAPLVPRLLGGRDRRGVLAAAMLVLALGNVLTAVASGFGLLVVSRIILGVGMGVVWGLASAVATRLVAPRDIALAVSCAVSGVAAASVVGVPLGTIVGNAFGWRAAFGALAAAAVLLGVGLRLTLPRLSRPAPSAGSPSAGRGTPLSRRAPVVAGLILVVFLVTAHFAAYTYVRPILEERAALTPSAVALLLLIYGVFGLGGNFAAGALAARRARATVLTLTLGITASITLLVFFGAVAWIAGAAIALWGLAYGGLSVSAQIWMTQSAPDRLEQVTGLYVGVFTAAIALGAFLGGVVVEAAGITALLWGGGRLGRGRAARGPARPRPGDRVVPPRDAVGPGRRGVTTYSADSLAAARQSDRPVMPLDAAYLPSSHDWRTEAGRAASPFDVETCLREARAAAPATSRCCRAPSSSSPASARRRRPGRPSAGATPRPRTASATLRTLAARFPTLDLSELNPPDHRRRACSPRTRPTSSPPTAHTRAAPLGPC